MVFLEISQNSQENTCARASFLIKSCIPRTLFLQNTSGRLLLKPNVIELKSGIQQVFVHPRMLRLIEYFGYENTGNSTFFTEKFTQPLVNHFFHPPNRK